MGAISGIGGALVLAEISTVFYLLCRISWDLKDRLCPSSLTQAAVPKEEVKYASVSRSYAFCFFRLYYHGLLRVMMQYTRYAFVSDILDAANEK
jgi:hypothetical protein